MMAASGGEGAEGGVRAVGRAGVKERPGMGRNPDRGGVDPGQLRVVACGRGAVTAWLGQAEAPPTESLLAHVRRGAGVGRVVSQTRTVRVTCGRSGR